MLPKKPGRQLSEDAWALCALLSIWICVIIFFVKSTANWLETFSDADSVPALIIDPGHGGMDGGAVASDGTVESRINLDISMRLWDLARFLGIDAVMTRTSEELDYPPEASTVAARKRWDTYRRVELINDWGGILLSIHQNYYPTAQPYGMQVLYASGESSKQLGELMQLRLSQALLPENRRVAMPASGDIYIMSHVCDPAVLIECGFLSNPRETQLLIDPAYQTKIAAVLVSVFLEYTGDESE